MVTGIGVSAPPAKPVSWVIAGVLHTGRECPACGTRVEERRDTAGDFITDNYSRHWRECPEKENYMAETKMRSEAQKEAHRQAQARYRAKKRKRAKNANNPWMNYTPSESAVRYIPSGSKYGTELEEAARIAIDIRGAKFGSGLKQHAHVREVMTDLLGGPEHVTPDALAQAAGFETMAEIQEFVEGKNPPGTKRAIRRRFEQLDEKMGESFYVRGLMLASILVAWSIQLDRAD